MSRFLPAASHVVDRSSVGQPDGKPAEAFDSNSVSLKSESRFGAAMIVDRAPIHGMDSFSIFARLIVKERCGWI